MNQNTDVITEIPTYEWPRLVPFDTPNLPDIDLGHLPSWAGEFAHALSKDTETPPELSCAMVLASCAAATARRICVEVQTGYTEPCNLWLVAALPPGNRKSSVQSAAAKPLLAWEREQAKEVESELQKLVSERKTAEVVIKEKRNKAAKEKDELKAEKMIEEINKLESSLPPLPIIPRLWTSDVTPEQLGNLLAEQDECIAWLSSEGGIFDMLQGRYSGGIQNLDLILKSHSGDSDRVDRGGRSAVWLNYPRLTIGLSPQPDVLRGLASKPGFDGRGLLARFLYLLPKSPLGYRRFEVNPIPSEVKRRYHHGLISILNIPLLQNEHGDNELYKLKLSKEAFNEWHEFRKVIEFKFRPGQDFEHATSWAAKCPGAAIRLAGVLHTIKHSNGRPWEHVITAETMSSSLSLIAVISKHSLAAMGLMGSDQNIAAAKYVWEWFQAGKRNAISERDVFSNLRSRFPRMELLRNALKVLIERGYIDVIRLDNDLPGRKPSPLIYVRPEIMESW